MKKNVLLGAVAGALTLATTTSLAATSTTSFGVSATVVDSCSVSATDMQFGTIDPIVNASTATDASSVISVTCANGTAYNVGLDAGTGAGATVSTRTMANGGGQTLSYSLYTDAFREVVWGETVGSDTVGGTGIGAEQQLTVYGRLPAGQQSAPVGVYTDTIQVTVSY